MFKETKFGGLTSYMKIQQDGTKNNNKKSKTYRTTVNFHEHCFSSHPSLMIEVQPLSKPLAPLQQVEWLMKAKRE